MGTETDRYDEAFSVQHLCYHPRFDERILVRAALEYLA